MMNNWPRRQIDNDILADEELSFFNKTVRAYHVQLVNVLVPSLHYFQVVVKSVELNHIDNVEKQTEQFNTEDTFWYAVKFGQLIICLNFIEGDKDCLPKEKRVEANETYLRRARSSRRNSVALLCLFGLISLAMKSYQSTRAWIRYV